VEPLNRMSWLAEAIPTQRRSNDPGVRSTTKAGAVGHASPRTEVKSNGCEHIKRDDRAISQSNWANHDNDQPYLVHREGLFGNSRAREHGEISQEHRSGSRGRTRKSSCGQIRIRSDFGKHPDTRAQPKTTAR
jgi:hypothetical protein